TVCDALGLSDCGGLVRAGIAPYTTEDDVRRLVEGVERIASGSGRRPTAVSRAGRMPSSESAKADFGPLLPRCRGFNRLVRSTRVPPSPRAQCRAVAGDAGMVGVAQVHLLPRHHVAAVRPGPR